jgi:hypothetical protein
MTSVATKPVEPATMIFMVCLDSFWKWTRRPNIYNKLKDNLCQMQPSSNMWKELSEFTAYTDRVNRQRPCLYLWVPPENWSQQKLPKSPDSCLVKVIKLTINHVLDLVHLDQANAT